jgi:hypothetical protein
MAKHGFVGFFEGRRRKRYQKKRVKAIAKGGKHTAAFRLK